MTADVDSAPAATPPTTDAPAKARPQWYTTPALGCLTVGLLLCGIVALFAVVAGQVMPHGLTHDPNIALERSKSIAEFEVPAGFEPKIAFVMRVPLFGKLVFSWVIYEAPSSRNNATNRIIIGRFTKNLTILGSDQLVKRLEDAVIDQQDDADIREFVEVLPETREIVKFKIDNEPAEFIFSRGPGTVSDADYNNVAGQFESNGGTGVIIARVVADQYSRDDLEKMVRSIRPPRERR